MKRSKMLEIIAETIYNTDMEDDCEILAEYILSAIEKAGMQPPETKGLRLEAVNPFTVNKWESEINKHEEFW